MRRILSVVALVGMVGILTGCGAAAPLILSGVAGGLTIAKDVVGLDIQLVNLKHAIDDKPEPPPACPPL